jgi:DNA modification methylase
VSVEIIQGDCVQKMNKMSFADRSFDLIFADPPFNIGWKYDCYDDRRSRREYLSWTSDWMFWAEVLLKPTGSIWVAAPDECQHRLRVILEDSIGLRFRAHVIWHFGFGQHRKRGFTRSHVHLLHYSKSDEFTWNGDAIKVPSWRQLNGDRRAASGGRHPDDVWRFPRICGTHKERVGWHSCQMPEAILSRIIRVSSNPGDMVLDPFLGSGTTGAVAKKLGRNFVGVELSENYAEKARERIAGVKEQDRIQGEATSRSADAVVRGRGLSKADSIAPAVEAMVRPTLSEH